jgi:hypothetical protein
MNMENESTIVADAPVTDSNQAEEVGAETTAAESQVAEGASAETTASETQTESTLPEFAQQGWAKINSFISEMTGKTPDEVRNMSLADRVTATQSLWNETQEKLATLQAEGEFVGIKIDAPADKWDAKRQIEALPAVFQNKLIGEALNMGLPTFVEESLANPESHPQEFALLDQAAMVIAQKAFGRDPAEMKAIFDLTRGISPEQLYQVLSGSAGQVSQPTNGANQYGVAQGMPSSLAQQALAQGYEPTDPFVQQLHARDMQFNQLQNQYQVMQKQVNDLSGYREQQQQTVQQQAVEKAHSVIDGQADAARKGALEAVTKGRVPENEMGEVSELIGLKAVQMLSSNTKAQNYLQLAKAWQADGLDGKAKGQLALYAAAAEKAYREASSSILGRLVTQTNGKRTTDAQKAQRKELGATAAATNTANIKPPVVSVTDSPGEYAAQLYQQSQS